MTGTTAYTCTTPEPGCCGSAIISCGVWPAGTANCITGAPGTAVGGACGAFAANGPAHTPSVTTNAISRCHSRRFMRPTSCLQPGPLANVLPYRPPAPAEFEKTGNATQAQ